MVSYLDKILLELEALNEIILEKNSSELRELKHNFNIGLEQLKVLNQEVYELTAEGYTYTSNSNTEKTLKSPNQSSSKKGRVINSGFHNLYLTEMRYQKETNSKLDEMNINDNVSKITKEENIQDKIILDDKVAYILRKKYN